MLQLNKILKYKNKRIINRFLETYNVNLKEAEDIFKETLRYLYLSAYTENKRKKDKTLPSLGITFQMLVIDQMWHAFILDTRDYQDFCTTYLYQFIHHPPAAYGRNKDTNNVEKESEAFNQTVGYIYDVLGEEIVEKWFSTYAEKYSIEKLLELRKGL